jgi:protein-L-isoaspartate(D-aspartate) O-methyltransferase
MHANAATALEEYATPGAKVLDVGCGSGYLTAVFILTTEGNEIER